MASCTYTDGTSLTVRYSDANPGKKRELQNGKVWSPGDVPMLLFTETPVTVSGVQLGVGAYSMFVIPDKGKWTLIINKHTGEWGIPYKYQSEELARIPMTVTKLPAPAENFTISFDHTGASCTMRISWENTQASVEFAQKNSDLATQP